MGQSWGCSHIGLLSLLQLASQLGHHTRQLLLKLHLLQIMFSWQYLRQQEQEIFLEETQCHHQRWLQVDDGDGWYCGDNGDVGDGGDDEHWWWWGSPQRSPAAALHSPHPWLPLLGVAQIIIMIESWFINQFDQIILYNDKGSPFLKYVASVLWRGDNFVFGQIWNFRFMY